MNSKIKYFLADTAKSLYSLVTLAILITVLGQPVEVKAVENGLESQSDVFEQYFVNKEMIQTNSYLSAYFRVQEKLSAEKTLRQGVLAKKILSATTFKEEEKVFYQELKTEPKVFPDKVVEVVMTAYTSTPDQTDDSPFIAASGKYVYDGMLAANWLPFGTKIKIPELYGDKIFTVDDRMNSRYGYGRMDIWLDTTKIEAKKFGVKRLTVEVYYQNKVEQLVLVK
ncbi:MAG: hypothetical protein COU29_02105 [Candidatus Magasanikbacteria bacterium CG10_big_fil_rev_8_21_14_0_10_36_32]|uniref:3D domain-containing protein n=1 Tax=Candidatus Magasanikbacteria bacterium CG10_big_fil_rev_8_21_14_0_10_36_32 TaxID=1974646 RepID=A0A2M6W6Z3_9BACT|nr:MAG: hypothetical protein COU29_02105 [Candidatus Magasanikbacteria bacterium CG10_big_fil_rev_8_21_14_0_10_36_32]